MSCQRKIEHSKLAQISSNMHPLTIIWIPVPEEDPCSGEVLIVIYSLFGMHLRPMTMKLKILIKRIKGYTCMSYSYMVGYRLYEKMLTKKKWCSPGKRPLQDPYTLPDGAPLLRDHNWTLHINR